MKHAGCPENPDLRLRGCRSRPAAGSHGESATARRCWQWSICQESEGSYDVDVHTAEKQHIMNSELHIIFAGYVTFGLDTTSRKYPYSADAK